MNVHKFSWKQNGVCARIAFYVQNVNAKEMIIMLVIVLKKTESRVYCSIESEYLPNMQLNNGMDLGMATTTTKFGKAPLHPYMWSHNSAMPPSSQLETNTHKQKLFFSVLHWALSQVIPKSIVNSIDYSNRTMPMFQRIQYHGIPFGIGYLLIFILLRDLEPPLSPSFILWKRF